MPRRHNEYPYLAKSEAHPGLCLPPQHQDLGHFNSGPALLAFCPLLVHGQPRFTPRTLTVLSCAISGCGCPHVCPTLMALCCPLHHTCFLGVTLGPAARASPRKLASSRLPSVGQLATAPPPSVEPDGSVGAAHSQREPRRRGSWGVSEAALCSINALSAQGNFLWVLHVPRAGTPPQGAPLQLGTRSRNKKPQ